MSSWGRYLASGCRDESSPSTHVEEDEVTSLSTSDAKLFQKVEHAFRTKLCLSPFSSKMAIQFLHSRLSLEGGPIRFERVVNYVLDVLTLTPVLIGDKEAPSTTPIDWQAGCPNVIKGLRACPIWNNSEFPWIRTLEQASSGICSELMALRGQKSFQPYRAPKNAAPSSSSSQKLDGTHSDSLGSLGTSVGDWNVCYLHLHGLDVGDTLKRCPITAAAIESVPRHYCHAFFSALAPNTHVTKHHGSTNKKLRCHLPLRVPKGDQRYGDGDWDGEEKGPGLRSIPEGNDKKVDNGPGNGPEKGSEKGPGKGPEKGPEKGPKGPLCWLRVADQMVPVREGKAIVFDDSFEHEAANEHAVQPRVVLVVDFWHPDFDDEEVKFLEFISKGQMACLKAMSNKQTEPQAPSCSPSTSSSSMFSSPSSFSSSSAPHPTSPSVPPTAAVGDDTAKPSVPRSHIDDTRLTDTRTTDTRTTDARTTGARTTDARTTDAQTTDARATATRATDTNSIEPDTFLTVIRRARGAAHTVSEGAVWGD